MLEKIDFSFKQKEDQTLRFTPSHIIYIVTFKYNNKTMDFDYQCNPKYGLPTKEECLNCVLSDAFGYEDSMDILDFAYKFGYNNTEYTRRVYKGCKEMSEKIHNMFTDEEIEILANDIEMVEMDF